jgi:hypothetical protein
MSLMDDLSILASRIAFSTGSRVPCKKTWVLSIRLLVAEYCTSVVDPGPHPFGNLDPHQSNKLDPEPDPHQIADDKLKCTEYEPILAVPGRLFIPALQ